MKSVLNKANGLLALGAVVCFGLVSCGGGNTTAQNMPVGGTPFTTILTPGVGNLTKGATVNTCIASSPTETLYFTESAGGAASFQSQPTNPTYTAFSGTFTNPVNQNNPCFTGNVSFSGCSYAQGGTIKFNACSVNLIGSGYTFSAVYYLYTASGVFIQSGNVNATK